MGLPVKGRYDASGRRRRAAATRDRILAIGLGLFSERGYAGTTVAAVAEAAQVHPDTVFALFQSKPKLLAAAIVAAERAGGSLTSATAQDDPNALIDAAIRRHLEIAKRLSRAVATLREGATIDPLLQELIAAGDRRRLRDMTRWVTALDRAGALTSGLGKARASDAVWLLLSADTHLRLVVERGWGERRYRDFLAGTLTSLLLGAPRDTPSAAPPRSSPVRQKMARSLGSVTSVRK